MHGRPRRGGPSCAGGRWRTVETLSVCLLLKRAVLEAVGGPRRAARDRFLADDDLGAGGRGGAGFELAVAHDLFVQSRGAAGPSPPRGFSPPRRRGQGTDATRGTPAGPPPRPRVS